MCAINRISMLLRTAPTVVPTSVAQPISDTQPAASVSVICAFVEVSALSAAIRAA
jgi:hypothetical protein